MPSVHKSLTIAACELANRILEKQGMSLLTVDESVDLVLASVRQDTAVSLAKNRLGNWHFYNPEKEDKQAMAVDDKFSGAKRCFYHAESGNVINRSCRNDVAHRIERPLVDDPENIYLLGAACHFIQDSTVPAHVVPVYHGPNYVFLSPEAIGFVPYTAGLTFKLKDSLGRWPVKDIKWLDGDVEAVLMLADKEKLCESPVFAMMNFNFFVTQKQLQRSPEYENEINDKKIKQWLDFYNADVGNDYFLGFLSEHEQILPFGDESLGITEKSYEAFVESCHRQAILTSAALIVGMRMRTQAVKEGGT
jgi:hypothetical protein